MRETRAKTASLFAAAFLLICSSPAHPEEYAAGLAISSFTNELGDAELGIWYPSHSEELPLRLGFFDARAAKDGEPAAGSFPAVLLSHGYTSHRHSAHNHHLTAAALARAGFVVAVPQHTSDLANRKGEIGAARAIEIRVRDLSAALAAARRHPHSQTADDDSPIAVIGYSRGGLTALAAAGGRPQMAALLSHCRENGALDPGCQDSYITKALRFVRNTLTKIRELRGRPSPPSPPEPLAAADEIQLPPPLNVRAVVAIAPLGTPFGGGSVDEITAPVFIHRFGDDKVAVYPFHAENLRVLLGARAEYKVHENVHHYAFTAHPISSVKKDFPAAQDQPGFDRAAFIRALNRQIIADLTTTGGE